jgi:hypothetical protein
MMPAINADRIVVRIGKSVAGGHPEGVEDRARSLSELFICRKCGKLMALCIF